MTTAVLWIACGALAGILSGRIARHLCRYGPIRRSNYRGLEVPTAVGVAVLLGFLSALGLLGLLRAIAPSSAMLVGAAAESGPFIALALGFGLLGLWDDLTGRGEERGWRAHLRALSHGRASAGAIKLAGGGALALVVVAPRGQGLVWTLVDAAIVALTANLFNLLDLRPGRAGKLFVIATAAMLIVGGPAAPALAAGIGAVAGFLPLDLRERGMLGDAGANGIGAIVGYGIVAVGAQPARAGALVVLLVLHLIADEPGLSRVIGAVPPLRALDRVGRVAE